MSKAERQKIALEKRQSEVRDQQEREDAERRQREEFDRAAEEERRRYEQERYGYNVGPSGRNDRDGYGKNGYGRDNRRGFGDRRDGPGPAIPSGPRGAALPVGPRSMQSRNGGGLPYDGLAQGSPSQLPSTPVAGSASPASASIAASGDAVPPSQAELEALRARYLGKRTDGKKPRLRKAQDKKIIFDWNEQDDTSAADQNSWTREVRELVPGGTMFGGRLAGMDGAKKNDARTDK